MIFFQTIILRPRIYTDKRISIQFIYTYCTYLIIRKNVLTCNVTPQLREKCTKESFQDQTLCIVAVFLLGFFGLACFTFLFLESLVIVASLVDGISCISSSDGKILVFVLIGIITPLVYTAVAVGALHSRLLPKEPKMCVRHYFS